MKHLLILTAVIPFTLMGCSESRNGEEEMPNILIIYADDLGYGDVQMYNPERGKIPTPNIDLLAKQGMRFTDAHSSSAVCSPSRYTLLTGRYHWRSRLQSGIVPLYGPPLITPDRLTIAGLVKQQGYHSACIGKWHLGWEWPIPEGMEEIFKPRNKKVAATDSIRAIWKEVFSQKIPGGPTSVGFDEYFGTDVPNWPPYCFIENDHTVGIPSEYGAASLFGKSQASSQGPSIPGWKLEDILPELGKRSIEFIDRMAETKKTFLLYLPLTAPHTPLAVTKAWRGKSGISLYADLVMEADATIGKVLEALAKNGLEDNTLVIFTSDNGCAPYIGDVTIEEAKDTTFKNWRWSHEKLEDMPVKAMEAKGHFPSGPLRGYKSDVWEGGHRIPFIVRWPGKVKPGTVSTQLIHQADVMATLADILNVPVPENEGEDSFSLLALLKGKKEQVRENAVSTSIRGMPELRKGPWKLILGEGSGGWCPGGDGQPVQLYNLDNDLAETNNLAEEMPDKVAEMRALMEKIITDGRSNEGPQLENDVEVKRY